MVEESETGGGVGSDPMRVDSGSGGARYKLMSPAKLPISRGSCITIPPGLSPTSFLESPVLLSNVKVGFCLFCFVWLMRKCGGKWREVLVFVKLEVGFD